LSTVDDVSIFRASRKKYLCLCVFQVLVGTLCFLNGRSFPPMYVIAAFVGVLALVCGWEAVAKKTSLTLNNCGFEYLSIYGRVQFAWNETSAFVANGYAVRFERIGAGPRMIPNLFDASMDEVSEALVRYRRKYGGETAATGESSITR